MLMYLQEELRKKLWKKTYFCCHLESPSAKNRRIRILNPVYGSKDPVPYKMSGIRNSAFLESEPYFPNTANSCSYRFLYSIETLPLSASTNQMRHFLFSTLFIGIGRLFFYMFIYTLPFSQEEIV